MSIRVGEIIKILKAVWFPLVSCLLIILLFQFVFLLGYVPTESMEPTLRKNSFFLGIRICQDVHTGDIVVFEREGRLLVKRIAAGPGDVIVRNGTSLIVPEGHYYMLGDNPGNSYDARYWEDPFVSEAQIEARVLF